MKTVFTLLIVPLLFLITLTVLHFKLPDNGKEKSSTVLTIQKTFDESVDTIFLSSREQPLVLDTLYTAEHSFIEINLKTQMAMQYYRDGSSFEFPVSTGTRAIEEGQTTNEGLYCIQLKVDSKYSDKFTDALLINWMAYNYGIGLHGLVGNGYYRYLGVRPSSHGCVRVGREDVKKVFDKSVVGTPVLVHSGNNAITIAFTDSTDDYVTYSNYQLRKILPERQNALYRGEYFYECNEKILLEKRSFANKGLTVGDRSQIAEVQRPVIVIPFNHTIAHCDILNIMKETVVDTTLIAFNR